MLGFHKILELLIIASAHNELLQGATGTEC